MTLTPEELDALREMLEPIPEVVHELSEAQQSVLEKVGVPTEPAVYRIAGD
jgi:hypothetical protein